MFQSVRVKYVENGIFQCSVSPSYSLLWLRFWFFCDWEAHGIDWLRYNIGRTLSLPHFEEEKMKNLDKLQQSELLPHYQAQVHHLVNRVNGRINELMTIWLFFFVDERASPPAVINLDSFDISQAISQWKRLHHASSTLTHVTAWVSRAFVYHSLDLAGLIKIVIQVRIVVKFASVIYLMLHKSRFQQINDRNQTPMINFQRPVLPGICEWYTWDWFFTAWFSTLFVVISLIELGICNCKIMRRFMQHIRSGSMSCLSIHQPLLE